MRVQPVRLTLSLVATAGIAVAVTLLFLGMRSVMGVGGYCASGGPYQIRVECPHAIDWLLPVSVIGGVLCLFVFLVSSPDAVRRWAILAWTGLFLALGWNFFDFGLPWQGHPGEPVWIVLGFVFLVLALSPIVPVLRSGRRASGQAPGDEQVDFVARSGHGDAFTWEWSSASRSEADSEVGTVAGVAIAAALQRLAQLHRTGELTDAEYAAAKQALLEADQ